jgi:serine/threonine protein kinase/WD40 repeat protein/tetratricopeptide (TPR) repeat protein
VSGEPGSDPDPLNALAEEFAARYRRGERPSLSEYTRRHPGLAARIRELFPALVLIEELGSVAGGEGPPASVAAPGAQAEALSRLGEYRILREVGRGGMGVVYEAVQESLGRHVALKVLPADAAHRGQFLERFRREARAAAKLHHTNIVPVFGVGEDRGTYFYVMQFIPGQGLDAVLRDVRRLRGAAAAGGEPTVAEADPAQGGTTPPGPGSHSGLAAESAALYCRAVARLGVQAAEALHYAHGQGVLHRDVKPSNLLLDAQGTLWITDFGLAKADDGDDLTASGDLVGTLRYMAPERLRGQGDARADVYGLGLTLYELLTLRPAFDATDRERLREQVTSSDPPLPRRLNPEVPRDLETVVLKAVAREPAHRYASAEELAADLRRFLDNRPIRARRVGAAEQLWRWGRRNPVVAGLLLAVLAALAAVAGVSAGAAVRIAGARDDEATAKGRAEQSARESLQRLARLHVEKGVGLMDEGDAPGATVCFAEALRLAPGSPEEEAVQRTRLAALRRSCAWPVRSWAVEGTLVRAQFSSDGRRLFTASAEMQSPGVARRVLLRVWDTRTGRAAAVGSLPLLRGDFAELSQDGRRVLLAVAASVPGPPAVVGWQAEVWDAETGARVAALPREKVQLLGLGISADGRRLYTSTAAGARVWDADTGKPVSPPIGRGPGMARVALSTDGERLATAAYRTGPADPLEVRVWEAATGKPVRTMPWPVGGSLTFSPDGRRLLQGGELPAVYDLATGRALARPLAPPRVRGRAPFGQEGPKALLGPDGRRVVTVRDDDGVYVWDADSGDCLGSGRLPRGGAVTGAALSGDGRRLLTLGADGLARVWDAASAEPLLPPLCHGQELVAGAFGADGREVLVVGRDGRVQVWDLAAAGPDNFYLDAGGGVTPGWLVDEGRRVLAGGGPGQTARAWDVATGAPAVPPVRLTARAVEPTALPQFSPDGRRVAGQYRRPAGPGGSPPAAWLVYGWDVASGQYLFPPLEGAGPPRHLRWSADGRYLAVMRYRGGPRFGHAVSVYDGDTGKEVAAPLEVNGPALMAFSPGGRLVVSRVEGGPRLWDVAAGGPARTLEGATVSDMVACSPDGRRLLAGGAVYDAATGRSVCRLAPGGDLTPAAFSPDGRLVLTGGAGGWQVWDAETGERRTPLLVRDRVRSGAAFSGSGALALTVGDGAARVWGPATGDPVTLPLRYEAPRGPVPVPEGRWEQVWFGPGGLRVVALGHDRAEGSRVRTWDLTPDDAPADDLAALAEWLAGRRLSAAGGLVPLSAAELQARERRVHARYPEGLACPPGKALAWHRREAAECLGQSLGATGPARAAALPHLDRLIALAPGQAADHFRRGNVYAWLGRWEEAAADFGLARELGPDDYRAGCGRAYALLARGDLDGYRQECAGLLRRYGDATDPQAAEAVAALWVLAPAAGEDFPPRLAETVARAYRPPTAHRALTPAAWLLYRAGQVEAAARQVRPPPGAAGGPPSPGDYLLLALAEQKQGKSSEARRWLEKAGAGRASAGTGPGLTSWASRVQFDVLRREAAAAIGVDAQSGARP